MSGTLYIVATPIGNLGDITLRALETLKSVDVICAEDTRHTVKLLNHYEIKKKLLSYHEYSPEKRDMEIVALLEEGKNVALVSDAGMPLISDPGAPLTAMVAERGIPMTVVPGACAGITALALSAISAEKFVFEGFIPRDKTRKETIDRVCSHEFTTILYESPHQLKKTLQELSERIPGRKIAICKELTKLHESIDRTTVAEAYAARKEGEIRGEYVLILAGRPKEEAAAQLTDEAIIAHLKKCIEGGMTNKKAVEATAVSLNAKKNRVYKLLLELGD
ncbi:MAG: 16S rRNA (cytidine(1402)-2'-O)-methyltransferase [Christensenellaceae bacterium]|nr:16S rRNA (cytidine(1402)-2'-O)-methyltransferase [Christensenellaceae bacterium]